MTVWYRSCKNGVFYTGIEKYCDDCTPVVVIDPEDETTLRSIGDLLVAGDRGYDDESWQDLQAAFRGFANPKPPKPEEPTGHGAVVRDAEGTVWTRVNRDGGKAWWYTPCGRSTPHWDYIDAVEELNPGVPE